VLGPVEVRVDGRPVPLGGPKPRALLAVLLLHRNEVVSRDRLIESLWGERPPSSAQASLDTYISRLRSLLGVDRIERRPPGYLLRVEPGELDLDRFEALFEEARAAAAAGDLVAAQGRLDDALDLWRGRALADLEPQHVFVEPELLEERRLLAFEARVDAELGLGGGAELIRRLESLVAANPYRERLIGQLMSCLYRGGRQTEALAVYQACRHRFADEFGIEPGSELRALERRILQQDPALSGNGPAGAEPSTRRRPRARLVLVGIGLVAAAAGVGAGVELATGGAGAASHRLSAPAVFELARGGSTLAATSLADSPAAIVSEGGSIWLAVPGAGAVIRVDRRSGRAVDRIPLHGTPSALAAGGGAVWTTGIPGSAIDRIDPSTDGVTLTIPLGGARASALAFGLGRLWVADTTDETLLEFDPLSGALRRTFALDLSPNALAVGAGAVWATDYAAGLVARIDPRSGGSIPIRVGTGPVAVAVGGGAVWVANSLDSTVSRIDPISDTVTATNSVGSYPVAIAIDGSSVSVADEDSSTISRLDARTGRLVGTSATRGDPTTLTTAGGRVWVGARPGQEHRGGELVLLHTRPLSLDPGLAGDLPPNVSNGLTYDTLLTHPRSGGAQALLLVPDLAVAVPVAADGGRSFAFRLRPGIRYSTGRLVRAGDFRRAIERLFRLSSSWSSNYLGIVGATECTTTHCDLRHGIVTDDAAGTVVFHLSAPDPNFLASLIYIASAPVPPGTPMHDAGDTIPGTGPYVVARASANETLYARNHRFREWSHAAQPDGNPNTIVMRYGLTPAQEVSAVERGQADWTADPIPPPLMPAVKLHFAAQVHYLDTTETDFLQLNTTVPPFDDLRVRQALNLAIDRAGIVKIFGGPRSATATCQILPPGILGYRRYCPYTRQPQADGRWHGPDMQRARRLVRESGTRGETVTVWAVTDGPLHEVAVAHDLVHVLRQLGFRAPARLVPSSFFGSVTRKLLRRMQLTFPGDADTTPFGFLGAWFLCSAPLNHAWFCDPRVDAAIGRADAVEATDVRSAGALWQRIDHQLVDRAVWVPLVNPHWIDLVSKRVRNYEAYPNLGLIADQVTLR